MKIQLFRVLDAARDVGLKIESSQTRLAKTPNKINKFISKRALWYYQEKYTKNSIDSCRTDRGIVEEHQAKLEAEFEKFVEMTHQLGLGVQDGIKKDVHRIEQSIKSIKAEFRKLPVEPEWPTYDPKTAKCPKSLGTAEDVAECKALHRANFFKQ